jgi:hypothetical protein
VQALLRHLRAASRPTGTATVSASMPISEHGYAGRSLVLVAYPARDGACVMETYVTAPRSQAFDGKRVRGGRCQGSPCQICIPPYRKILPSDVFVSLVTDRADAVRVTFATSSQPTDVFHHDYVLRGPDLPRLRARVFMLDPTADAVLTVQALKHGRVIATDRIAGLA